MTAPVIEQVEPIPDAPAEGDAGIGEIPVRFPCIAVEELDTADGRFISGDALTARPTPLTVLAQSRAAHGGQPPPAAFTVGRIDTLERVPGPDVISAMTGQPFPEGTYVWRGTGTIDGNSMVEGRRIGELLRLRYLRFISADLVPSDFEIAGDGDPTTLNPDFPTRRAVVHKADLAGLTIIPVSAFGDCTVELDDGEPAVEVLPAEADLAELGLAASAFPAWRSAEIGDYPALVAAGDEPHTGGMIALIPANPDELTVEGGDPAEDMHLTLAYLGDDVTGWDEEARTGLMGEMEQVAAGTPPVEAEVMGHALLNPTGAHDREPCAVHLVSGQGLAEAKAAVEGHDKGDHPIFIPHVTAGYGLDVSALSFVGPVVFDRLRVALAEEVMDYPLGGTSEASGDDFAAVPGEEGSIGPGPAEYGNPHVYARDTESGAGNCVCGRPPEHDLHIASPLAADGASSDLPHTPEEAPMPDVEVGMPDAPQPCAGDGDEHPATVSLLFNGSAQYAPTCAEHRPDAEAEIVVNGFEVEQVVEIPAEDEGATDGAVTEQGVSSRTADHA